MPLAIGASIFSLGDWTVTRPGRSHTHHHLTMSVLRVILYIHIGVFGGLQNHQTNPQPELLGDWNVSQISVLLMSPEGNLDRPDPETSEAATHFLYTGDAAKLLQVNCTRRVEIRGTTGEPAVTLHSLVHGAIDTMVHATNFLNLVFQTNDIRESSVKDDIEWYQALVRSIVEGDPKIYKAMLHLDVPTMPSRSHLVLQATKYQNEIFLQELSATSDYLENQTSESEWFNGLKYQRTPYLNKKILNNDLKTLDTPKWSQGDSYLIDKSHVKWSSPFLDCEDDKLVPRWMMTMSSSFYGLKPDLSPEFKGVIRIDVNLQSVDIDQCSTGDSWFADSHQCDVNSTECTPLKGQGFQLGAYQCVCKEGYYNPNLISTNSFSRQEDKHISYFSQYAVGEPSRLFLCLPCRAGCGSCVSDASCLTREDRHLRLAVLSFQAFCMLLVFISMLVVYRFRKNKRIRASGLLLLETILGGSILLYFPVFILYFQPSVFRCVLLRWVRMLGFAIIYGTITLKIYRVLKVFLSRTAQRVPYMTCCRVLKMLGVIVLTVCWFLIAWTVAAWENMDRKIPLVIQSQTPDGQAFNMCQLDRWDYMMATAEFLFLCWGSYLCYAVRTVPSMYHEPRFMGLAIHNEILMSAAFYSVRFTMAMTLHPDWMLLLFFAHSHLTVTVALILLFIPKFLHVGAPLRRDIVAEVYEDELDLRCSGSYLNSSITSAWSDHSLDPDDIRDELKKLYAQLEVHKTKKMTTNNPHLQKKRSSRRGLGRSIIKRISEIPESMSRHGSRDERAGSFGAGSYLGSYRKKLYESSSSSSSMRVREDSIKHRGFSIRKSHSTYDHMRDHRDGHISRTDSSSRDPSLLDSLMRKKLAKKASQRSNADSLDATPLVCKSASAHNLTVDKNPLHTKAATLQKSLSVVSCAREKALMLTKKCEENTKQVGDRVQRKLSAKQTPTNLQLPTVAAQSEEANKMSESARQPAALEPPQETGRPLLQDGRNKTLVCPWDFQNLQPPPSDTKVPKHVTYAQIKSSSVDSSNSSGKLQENRKRFADLVRKHRSLHQGSIDNARSWEVKETSTIQCETEVSTDTHPGAKTSPRVGKSVESSRTDAIHPGVHEEVPPKAKKTELASEKMDQVRSDGPRGNSKRDKYMSLIKQASTNSAIICPWDVMVEETAAMGTSADQKKGRSLSVCVFAPEPLAHGSLKAKDANDSLKHSKGFGLSLKFLMAPGKTKDSKKESSRKVSEKVKGSTDKEKEKENITEAVGLTGNSTAADICPWETGETKSKDEKSQSTAKSKVADISPLDTGSKRQIYMSLFKQASTNTAIICPWDIILEETSGKGISADQKKGRSLSVCTGVPGSLVHGNLEAKDVSDSLQQSKQLALSLKLRMAPGKIRYNTNKKGKSLATDKSKVADICPWETGDTEGKDTSLPIGKSKVADICPGETGDTQSKDTSQPIDKSKITIISPWETGDTESKDTLMPTDKLKVADICPWETGASATGGSQTGTKTKSNLTVVGATNQPENSPDQKRGRSLSVCTGVPGSLVHGTLEAKDLNESLPQSKRLARSLKLTIEPEKMKDRENKEGKPQPIDKSKVVDICPWETGVTQSKEMSLPIDKSKVTIICPWETGDSQSKDTSLPTDKSKITIICPWETGDTESKDTSLPTDKSKVTDICPWETGDTEGKETSLPIDRSKVADICPWETGASATGGSQTGTKTKSNLTVVGATNQPENSPDQKRGRSLSVCTGVPGSLVHGTLEAKDVNDSLPQTKRLARSLKFTMLPGKMKDGENKEGKSLPIDKSKVTDICPWETGVTQSKETSLPIDKSKVAIICPWETGDTQSKDTSLPIDKSKVADICPWETGDMESKDTSLPTDKSKVADICPWETGDTEGKDTSLPIGKPKVADICPWETGASATGGSQTGTKTKSNLTVAEATNQPENSPDQKRGRSLSVCTGVPGSLVHGTLEAKDLNESLPQSKRLARSLKLTIEPEKMKDRENKEGKPQPIDKSKVVDIYPWETGVTQSKEMSLPIDKSKVTIICPWETEDSQSKDTSLPTDKSKITIICPWETGVTQSKETSLPIDKSKVTIICPWETGDTESKDTSLPIGKSKVADICSWETGDTESKDTSLPTGKSKVADICPWETGASATGGSQTGTKTKSNLTVVEATNQPENSPDQKRGRSLSVCTGVPGSLVHGTLEAKDVNESLPQSKRLARSLKLTIEPEKMKDGENKEGKSLAIDKSKVADICPWETGVTQSRDTSLPTDKSKVTVICPWETGDTQSKDTSLPTDKSKVTDICPWETGITQSKDTSLPIDKSKVADICPWETGDTEGKDTSLPIGKSKVTIIYSFETEASATGESQTGTKAGKSNLTLISPWDVEAANQPENSPDQKRGRSLSVCTGVPGSLVHGTLEAKDLNESLPQTKRSTLSLKLTMASEKMKDGENKEGKPQPTDKSKVADICPWETGDTESKEETSLPSVKPKVADICPWETGASATGGSQTRTKTESNLTSISPWGVEATTANQPENKEAGKPKGKENVNDSAVSCPLDLV